MLFTTLNAKMVLKMIEIKTASSSEIKEIATLQANALLGTDYAPVKPEVMNVFINEIRRRCERLLNNRSDIFVLKDGNRTIGYTIFSRLENMIEMKNLYVEIKERGKGYGRELFQAVVSEAQKIKSQFIVTWIIDDNHLLKDFYTRLGFTSSNMSRTDQLRDDMEIKEVYYQYELFTN